MKVSPALIVMMVWMSGLWGFSLLGQPNELRFEHFGLEEGLPNMSIQTILSDRQGFLWIGTWDGLSRYDGQHFTNFYPSPLDTSTLSFQDVKGLDMDEAGKIWVATQGGLNRFDPVVEKFRRFLPEAGNPASLQRRFVNSAFCTAGQRVIVGMDYTRGFDIYSPDCEGFEHIFGQSGTAYDFLEMGEDIWIGTSNGLYILSPGNNTAQVATHTDSVFYELEGIHIRCFQRGLSGEIWVGTLNGLYCYFPEKNILTHRNEKNGISHPYVLSLTCDKWGGVWAGTAEGLSYLPNGSERFSVFRHNAHNPFSLSNDVILSLHIDRAENLWIGTASGGLNKVQLKLEKKFKTWNHTFLGAQNRELTVFHFAEGRNNRLWLATNKGLYLLDKTSKAILNVYKPTNDGKKGLRSEGIFSVYEDGQENVYVGLMDEGLDVIRLKTGVVDHFPPGTSNPQNIPGKDIRAIKESVIEGRRIIWLATNAGWSGHNPENKMARSFSMKPQSDIPWNGYIWDIFPEDSARLLWFISSYGLYAYDTRREIFTVGGWNPLNIGSGNLFYPVSILKTDNTVWLGTYGAGLLSYDLSTQTYQNYRIEHGLPNNMVYGILRDPKGHLWMSTNQGISRFDPATETFSNYHTEDGLQDEEFASGAFLQTRDGEMFFGGMNGFTSFYPDSIGEDNSVFHPQVLIQSVKVSGEEVVTDTVWVYRREIQLPNYRNQHLEISFISLDLTRPEKNLYQFKLEGYDTDWSKPSAKTTAQYTRIAPGDYRFWVKGTNSDGVFSMYSTNLKLILTPLWHETPLFQYGTPLALIGLIVMFVFLRIRRLRIQERLRLHYRIAMVKQEALAAQMNHHFTFNSLNSIQRFITENNKQAAIRYISWFGQLLRRALDHARKNYLTIEEELSTLDIYLSLEQLRTKNRFEYQLVTDPSVDIYNTEIPTNLLQPYVENAIWHGVMPMEDRKGKITVSFRQDAGMLTCVIEDNGIGRKKAAEIRASSQLRHVSKGMELIIERIDTLNTLDNTKIQVMVTDLEETTRETGTRVVVTMPVRG